MNSLLYYLLQVIVASGLLYLYYHIALRNKKFHQYNRFYLLAAVIISILVPFINIPVYFTQQQTQSSFVLQTLTVISEPYQEQVTEGTPPAAGVNKAFDPVSLLYYGYALLAALTLVKIVFSLLRIYRLKKNNPVEKIDSISFINTTEPGTPFSFFRWLFWNKNIELRSEKGEQIFRHELFHIQQKHSIDLLFMELLTVIFWINPFFHIMKKELRAIHEFLADQFAATRSDKWNYAELLLMQALQTKHSLVNPFFHNQIKRRIAMITNPQKTSFRYLRKLLVLPVAVLIIIAFAFNYKQADNPPVAPSKEAAYNNHKTETSHISITDTPIVRFTKKSTMTVGNEAIFITADSVIFHTGADDTVIDSVNATVQGPFNVINKPLIIMNGTEMPYSHLTQKTIVSDNVKIYSENDAQAIRLYGKGAAKGVIVFYNAKISDNLR